MQISTHSDCLCTCNFACTNMHMKPFYMHENQCMQILNLLSLAIHLENWNIKFLQNFTVFYIYIELTIVWPQKCLVLNMLSNYSSFNINLILMLFVDLICFRIVPCICTNLYPTVGWSICDEMNLDDLVINQGMALNLIYLQA